MFHAQTLLTVIPVTMDLYVRNVYRHMYWIPLRVILGYMIGPPTCVLCNVIANCDTCIDGPVCTLCNSGYAFDTSISKFL